MINELFNLKGKSGIVTGSSRGIGAAYARALAQAGANVVLAARSTDKLELLAEDLKQYGNLVIPCTTDINLVNSLDRLIEKTLDNFGEIDFLFNNAGIQRRYQPWEFPDEEWDKVIATNLTSYFRLSKRVSKYLIKQKSGKIINTASVISLFGGKTICAYAASKGGVAQLTKSFSNDLAKFGICVNAIAPGYIATELNEALIKDKKRSEEILSRVPAYRWGQPEELGGIAVFLASDASNYITGQVIYVDGGYTAM